MVNRTVDFAMESTLDIDKTCPPVLVLSLNRPHRRNAVDRETAYALRDAFLDFNSDEDFSVAILKGEGGNFCAGADLKSMLANGSRDKLASNPIDHDMTHVAPMGCTRLLLHKPVIAAISGCAVAGGLELALWCDLRVADETAFFGVYCRMRGVPLIDGGTIRLPKLIGLSSASDMILTGRQVLAEEAKQMGLVNYLADTNKDGANAAYLKAVDLAKLLASHPQRCLRNDRLSMMDNAYSPSETAMLAQEFSYGLNTLNNPSFGKHVDMFLKRGKL